MLGSAAGGWWLANRAVVAEMANDTDQGDATTVLSNELAMPDVRGLTQDDASQVLADSGFSAAIISFVDAPSGAPQGTVVAQTPAFGTSAPSKIILGLAVRATMPDLAGRTRDEAVTALSDLGVATTITLTYAPDATTGTVVSTSPATGEVVGESASITLASPGIGLPLGDVRRLSGTCGSSREASLGGRNFTTSVQCRADEAPESTVYFLQGRADEFTALIGVDDTGDPGTIATVEILADGAAVFSQNIAFGKPAEISLPVSGVLQLAIRVSSPNDDVTVVLGDATVRGSTEAIAEITQ
jgi:hypothetical protein